MDAPNRSPARAGDNFSPARPHRIKAVTRAQRLRMIHREASATPGGGARAGAEPDLCVRAESAGPTQPFQGGRAGLEEKTAIVAGAGEPPNSARRAGPDLPVWAEWCGGGRTTPGWDREGAHERGSRGVTGTGNEAREAGVGGRELQAFLRRLPADVKTA